MQYLAELELIYFFLNECILQTLLLSKKKKKTKRNTAIKAVQRQYIIALKMA